MVEHAHATYERPRLPLRVEWRGRVGLPYVAICECRVITAHRPPHDEKEKVTKTDGRWAFVYMVSEIIASSERAHTQRCQLRRAGAHSQSHIKRGNTLNIITP